jgi:hypothetical protein
MMSAMYPSNWTSDQVIRGASPVLDVADAIGAAD